MTNKVLHLPVFTIGFLSSDLCPLKTDTLRQRIEDRKKECVSGFIFDA